MATKSLLSLQNNDQLVSNLKRGTKALLWIEAGMIIFFWMNTVVRGGEGVKVKKWLLRTR